MECMRDRFQDGELLDGRFKTISPLNHGSFGMVFMAKDVTTDELVAIKCLTKRSATGDMDVTFAIDDKSEELACHGRLGSHPNIVNLIHSFETEAHIYLVLEFCSQGDLYEAIRTGCGPLETEHVREFMLQLIDAVDYVHSKGMYHRDIKPENIFLAQDGAVKLGDFGLATSDKWTYETTVGSDRYMAPEQFDSAGAGYSPAQADIWAIGICLLNILFSRNPFTQPNESDPLFLDFSRDKQSLFDVFSAMSQDTYEVVVQCMSLDPNRRSLAGAREALLRVVSFTTDDETLDDFCTSDRPAMVSANREPLRTPSIQSPQLGQESFPWAKALRASPQQGRQLSAIPDTETYDEDLFPSSEESNNDWFSVRRGTPSLASVLDSQMAASFKSLAIRRPAKKASPPQADVGAVSGSLPIKMSRPKPIPTMSLVFGKKSELVSKSWSDLYDEDEEEIEHEKEMETRQAQNARTWSHDSVKDEAEEVVVENVGAAEPKTSSIVNIKPIEAKAEPTTTVTKDIDADNVNDGFFFHDNSSKHHHYSPPRYSPPPKRTTFDKWSALGDRRRAYGSGSETIPAPFAAATAAATPIPPPMKSPNPITTTKGWRNVGLGFSGFGASIWDAGKMYNRDRGSPWDRVWARDRQQPAAKKQVREDDLGDLEWVGDWHHGVA